MQIQINRQNVFELLKETLRAENNQHNTQLLDRARLSPGFCLQLLVIADDKSIPIQYRQTALVTLKTTIDSYYFTREGKVSQIAQTDKQSLRDCIFQALKRNIQQTKLVPTITEIIYLIALEDYPSNWDITDKLAETLTHSEVFSQVYSALLALKSIASVYNSNTGTFKKPQLVTMMIKSFPPLLSLATKLMANYNNTSELLLLVVLKIFGYITYNQLVSNLRNSPSMHSWYVFIKRLLDFRLQEPTQNYIKIKKRSLKILLRFVQKHANPNYDKEYSQIFMHKYAGPFLQSIVLILLNVGDKKVVHNVALMNLPYFYKNFENCRMLLDQHKSKLMLLTITECFMTQQDYALWNDDPIESIHKQKEERKPLVEFIRSYSDCGTIVVNELVNAFKGGNDEVKEITLYLFSELRNQILQQVQQTAIVNIFVNIVFPQLLSTNPIIKARACSAVSSYTEDVGFPLETMKLVTSQMYECFNSTHLQIKIHAAKAIAEIIQRYQESIPMLQPYLTNILQGYLVVSEKVDSEEVVYSLQKIINKLADSIQPFAVDLFKALHQLFFKYCERLGYLNEEINDDDDDGDEENASNTCLGSIRAILLANLPQTFYNAVSQDIYNLVVFALSQKSYNFLQEGLNILNLYLFKSSEIQDCFLKLFPLLCYMITKVPSQILNNCQNINDVLYVKMIRNITQGVDSTIVENVIGSMRNFIAKTGVNFFSFKDIVNVSFMDRVFETVSSIKNSGSYPNMGYISTLLTTIVENNVGKIDPIVTQILKFSIGEIRSDNISSKLLEVYLQIVFICFYYNPSLTLSVFDQNSCTDFIFKGIINNPQLFKSDFEKKRLVLGLLRLFEIDQSTLANSSIASFIPNLLKLIVQLAIIATEQREKGNESSDSQCEVDDENTHLPLPQNKDAEEQSEDMNDQWESQYNKLYQSPIDNIDEVLLLGNFLLQKGRQYLQFLPTDLQMKLSEAIVKTKSQGQN